MAAFVTGDLHGGVDIHRLGSEEFPLGRTLTKDDYLIIAGDFGLVWDFTPEELYWREWLEARPWTTLFVDGNHENHPAIAELPERLWHGAPVHVLSPSVLHLERGQVYDICGSSVFVMGGATSIDRQYRVEGQSWWPGELPSEEEYDLATASLAEHAWTVDYVITHCCATRVLGAIYPEGPVWQGPDALTDWFDGLEHRLQYRQWYFGHHHLDAVIPPDHRALFWDVVPLGGVEAVR
ncbi:MAG: metallophosphoesterase [Atopobiaceae bacterium]|nr:metallophosphoesterase [Atopobiaceae bacterium]MCH4181063.1 metallophosphoesterase [Atopobiaceae bacterium]MCH4213441.1 metallophosphoesterase [Atopobiaceae bacterium]MCH4277078.1 metallophosphoesterase [Atopobiaceae bacterium]MCI1226738.1 metallophosphoesterase [Atopobiaceae bacterium]